MSTFTLADCAPPVTVTHPDCLRKDQLLQFPAFQTWLTTLQDSVRLQRRSKTHPFYQSPYALRSIDVQSVDFFGHGRLGFVKLKATVANDAGETLPGTIFLRGGSVAVLIVLTPAPSGSDVGPPEEYVVLTVQPRIPAGSLSFVELPAGMIDESGTFSGAAAKEIGEETGLNIASEDLVDMMQMTIDARDASDASHHDDIQPSTAEEAHLQAAVYPSPGGSDEFIPIFLARKTLPSQDIQALRGKLTGLRDEGEKITLKVVPLGEVWKVACRDAKTLAALTLYHGLTREGKL